MLDILGPDGKEIVSSGDETEDAESRANFVQKYQQMHRLVKEPDGTTTLYIGAENWPTPIPLVNKGNLWYFDTEAGEEEIVYRRVGQNELSAIRVCQELVAAQKEYYAQQNNQYAQKIFSDEGQHNGLYWKAAEGEPESPIGPLVASAVAEGFAPSGAGAPTPYRGYYYHTLTRQGKNAPGGAKSYIVNGKMTGGFRLRGLSGGIPIVRRDDIHRERGWSSVSEGSRQEDGCSCQSHEGIQPELQLAKGGRGARGDGRRTENPIKEFSHRARTS